MSQYKIAFDNQYSTVLPSAAGDLLYRDQDFSIVSGPVNSRMPRIWVMGQSLGGNLLFQANVAKITTKQYVSPSVDSEQLRGLYGNRGNPTPR